MYSSIGQTLAQQKSKYWVCTTTNLLLPFQNIGLALARLPHLSHRPVMQLNFFTFYQTCHGNRRTLEVLVKDREKPLPKKREMSAKMMQNSTHYVLTKIYKNPHISNYFLRNFTYQNCVKQAVSFPESESSRCCAKVLIECRRSPSAEHQ